MTATAVAGRAAEATQLQLDKVSATLADAPSEADVTQSLDAIAQADETLRQARKDAADAASRPGRSGQRPHVPGRRGTGGVGPAA